MGTLIMKFGNVFTGPVQMVFPEGDVAAFARKGLQIVFKASGHGMAGSLTFAALDAGIALQRKVYGGMTHPGTLLVYTDRVVFQPQALTHLFHEGVETITIPADIIRDVEIKSTLFIHNDISLHLSSGDGVRIIAGFQGQKIVNTIKSII